MPEYSTRFSTEDGVLSYENKEYAPESYATAIWKMQQPVLRDVLNRCNQKAPIEKLLDFACGTGRVLCFFEKFSAASDGLDISEAMAVKARERCQKAEIFVGDICRERDLLPGPYDVITSFRFLLNAGPELSLAALKELRSRLKTDRGLFLVNMHGNRGSIRHLFIMARRFRRWLRPAAHADVMMAEWSLAETRSLLEKAGFGIVEEIGFGVTPSFLYRTPLRSLCQWTDRKLAQAGFLRSWSIDIVFICKAI